MHTVSCRDLPADDAAFMANLAAPGVGHGV
jgi:hypothetical protein